MAQEVSLCPAWRVPSLQACLGCSLRSQASPGAFSVGPGSLQACEVWVPCGGQQGWPLSALGPSRASHWGPSTGPDMSGLPRLFTRPVCCPRVGRGSKICGRVLAVGSRASQGFHVSPDRGLFLSPSLRPPTLFPTFLQLSSPPSTTGAPSTQAGSVPRQVPLLSSHSVVSDSLQPHGPQHARLPCPPLSPGVCSDSGPLTRMDMLSILSSLLPPSPFASIFPSVRVSFVPRVPKSQSCSKSVRGCSLTPTGCTYLPGMDTQPATSNPRKLPLPSCLQGASAAGVPDSHSGVVGHSAHHGGLGALDDALVLWGPGDAGPG